MNFDARPVPDLRSAALKPSLAYKWTELTAYTPETFERVRQQGLVLKQFLDVIRGEMLEQRLPPFRHRD